MKINLTFIKPVKTFFAKVAKAMNNIPWHLLKSQTATIIYGVILCVSFGCFMVWYITEKDRKEEEEYQEQLQKYLEYQQLLEQLNQEQPDENPEGIISFQNTDNTTKVTYYVEYADTSEERELGLSGRDVLNEGAGMLFVYEQPTQGGFWMKNMSFPLDIVFLDENNKIVDIAKNQVPCADETSCSAYMPTASYTKALEINAGEADRYQLQIGNSFSLD